MSFVKVCKISDIRPGEGKVVNADGEEVAVFNVEGRIHAIQNNCPHKQGPLGEGVLDGEVVTCPWHGWRFNVVSGKNASMPTSIKTFPVKIENDDVYVNV